MLVKIFNTAKQGSLLHVSVDIDYFLFVHERRYIWINEDTGKGSEKKEDNILIDALSHLNLESISHQKQKCNSWEFMLLNQVLIVEIISAIFENTTFGKWAIEWFPPKLWLVVSFLNLCGIVRVTYSFIYL